MCSNCHGNHSWTRCRVFWPGVRSLKDLVSTNHKGQREQRKGEDSSCPNQCLSRTNLAKSPVSERQYSCRKNYSTMAESPFLANKYRTFPARFAAHEIHHPRTIASNISSALSGRPPPRATPCPCPRCKSLSKVGLCVQNHVYRHVSWSITPNPY